MNEIAKKFFIEMQNHYKCQLAGIGGSVHEHPGMEDQWFMYYFQYDLTKDQARYLLLSCADNFINSVNQTIEYQQYLPKPYSYENINLTFGFDDVNGVRLCSPKLGTLSILNKRLFFTKFAGVFMDPDCKDIVEIESLEQAIVLNEAYLKRVEAGLETLPF